MVKYKKGQIIKVTVTHIETYGAFVTVDNQYSGLIHISEISQNFVKDINDFLTVGNTINAKILDVDNKMGHIKLSIKGVNYTSQKGKKKKIIIETPNGFNTLKANLPIWINKKIKLIENKQITLDK